MLYVYIAIGTLLVIVLNIVLKYAGTILSGILTLIFFILSQVTLGWEALGFIIIAIMTGSSFILGTAITVLTNYLSNRK
jgi:hypothetical protein